MCPFIDCGVECGWALVLRVLSSCRATIADAINQNKSSHCFAVEVSSAAVHEVHFGTGIHNCVWNPKSRFRNPFADHVGNRTLRRDDSSRLHVEARSETSERRNYT